MLGGALASTAKAFGANDTIVNALGVAGGIGEMFFNPMGGGMDTLKYGSNLVQNEIQNKEYGGLTQFDGPKHSEGGIRINPQIEVEGGETMNQEFIFSDSVKPKGSKLSYAELSKRIENKYKKRGEDKMALEAKQRELDKLKTLHESDPQILKGREKQQATQMKFGGYKYTLGGNPFSYNPDDYTDGMITDPTEQPFATDFKRVYSGDQSSRDIKAEMRSLPESNNPMYLDSRGNEIGTSWNGEVAQSMLSFDPNAPVKKSMNTTLPSTKIPVGGALMNAIGPTSQLVGTLIDGVDPVNLNRFNPEFVNYNPAIDTATRNAGDARAVLRDSVQNNARNSGQALSNLIAGNVGVTSNLNEQVAGIKMNELNTNNQIRNQANQTNMGIANEEEILRQQNKAAYRQAIYGALTDVGNIGAGYMRDNQMAKAQDTMNQRSLDLMSSLPYRYGFFVDESGNIKTGVK
jgi:hypothetical protein